MGGSRLAVLAFFATTGAIAAEAERMSCQLTTQGVKYELHLRIEDIGLTQVIYESRNLKRGASCSVEATDYTDLTTPIAGAADWQRWQTFTLVHLHDEASMHAGYRQYILVVGEPSGYLVSINPATFSNRCEPYGFLAPTIRIRKGTSKCTLRW